MTWQLTTLPHLTLAAPDTSKYRPFSGYGSQQNASWSRSQQSQARGKSTAVKSKSAKDDGRRPARSHTSSRNTGKRHHHHYCSSSSSSSSSSSPSLYSGSSDSSSSSSCSYDRHKRQRCSKKHRRDYSPQGPPPPFTNAPLKKEVRRILHHPGMCPRYVM